MFVRQRRFVGVSQEWFVFRPYDVFLVLTIFNETIHYEGDGYLTDRETVACKVLRMRRTST
jgi:hypothetical protein